MSDPRLQAADDRDRLVRAALDAVDQASHPDRDQFDRCIIFFAQPTDLFGGGTHRAPNGKMISAAVFDIQSGFDQTCQEVGHTLGLQHELGAWYCQLVRKLHERIRVPLLGDQRGLGTSLSSERNRSAAARNAPSDPQRSVGPICQQCILLNRYRAVNPNGVFNHPDTVTYVPATTRTRRRTSGSTRGMPRSGPGRAPDRPRCHPADCSRRGHPFPGIKAPG